MSKTHIAETERLRAVLEKIASYEDDARARAVGLGPSTLAIDLARMARSALEGTRTSADGQRILLAWVDGSLSFIKISGRQSHAAIADYSWDNFAQSFQQDGLVGQPDQLYVWEGAVELSQATPSDRKSYRWIGRFRPARVGDLPSFGMMELMS